MAPSARIAKMTSGLLVLSLPVQFSYRVISAQKRHAVVQTHGGVRIHFPPDSDNLLSGDSLLQFTIPGADNDEWNAIRIFFLTVGMEDEVTFTGYWGDLHVGKFVALDDPEVNQTFFDVAGALRLI